MVAITNLIMRATILRAANYEQNDIIILNL